MSLGGLALGVGMLVDNSIVVLENIFRHREELGEDAVAAAAAGAEEVQAAMLVDEPPIYVGVGPEPRELWVAPVALQEGEEDLVARRLLAALTGQ